MSNDKLKDITFHIRRGEILGFGGLVGSGRTEIAKAIMGIDKHKGTIYKNGKILINKNPTHAIKNKFALVPEDRKNQGLVLSLSLLKNIILCSLKYFSFLGFMLHKKEIKFTLQLIKKLNIKTTKHSDIVSNLSGGNQQKIVMAKCLLTKPDILILDEPTRGIDIGSKDEIYEIIKNLADEGKSIILISSELPELIGISDRIIVMRDGKIVGQCLSKDATEEHIMQLATIGNIL